MIERYCYVLEYYYPRYQNILQDVTIKSKSWFYTCIKWQLMNSVCRVATWIFCICICMCVYTYVYIYIVYAYTHMHIFLYIYTYSMLHFIFNIVDLLYFLSSRLWTCQLYSYFLFLFFVLKTDFCESSMLGNCDWRSMEESPVGRVHDRSWIETVSLRLDRIAYVR